MTPQAIITISAAVLACVQFAKWSGIPDKYGPFAVLLLSAVGVGIWAWSVGTFARADAFDYFAGWIVVATSAAGVFGFSRASGEAVSRMTAPPNGGAGGNHTLKG